MVSWHMCECDFINTHTKDIAFPTPILSDLTKAQEHHEITYT